MSKKTTFDDNTPVPTVGITVPERRECLDKNFNNETDFKKINVLITNSRSLAPKYKSFLANFEERSIDIAAVTESWLTDGRNLDGDVQDLELGSEVTLIYKNRPARKSTFRRKACGGVVLAFNSRTCSFKERKIAGNTFEIVSAEGFVEGIRRKIVTYAIYIPPQTRADAMRKLCEVIANDISLAATQSNNPLLMMMGDFNRKCFRSAYEHMQGVCELQSGPTRGAERLDLCFTNADQNNCTTEVTPPLESETGTASDHACLVVSVKLRREKNFEWIKVKARKRTQKAVDKFGDDIRAIDWKDLLGDAPASEMVGLLHGRLDSLMDKNFPVRTFKRRSNSHLWMTNGIRARLKNEMKVFRKEGRSVSWRAQKKETRARIEEKKQQFISDTISQAKGDEQAAYYRAVKSLGTPSAPVKWDVKTMFPGEDENAIAKKVVKYFAAVSKEFTPLTPSTTNEGTNFRKLAEHEVAVRIKKAKKPRSGLPGDIFPELLTKYAEDLSVPLTIIYNKVLKTADWPAQWKNEHITVIPKKKKPQGLNECRNISCTNFWSKVLESIMLARLRYEIEDDPAQFGGLKGCGTAHFIAEVWTKIMTELEDPRKAVNLCSIDFSKAFNRMNHEECLEQLSRLGASETSIRIVRSFLTNRKMVVKIGDSDTFMELLSGGSPQGSVLGCYLYCATTQQLGPDLMNRTASSLGSLPRSPTGIAELQEIAASPETDVSGQQASSPDNRLGLQNLTLTTSTPTTRGQFASFRPDSDGSDDENDPWRLLGHCGPWNRIHDSDHIPAADELSIETDLGRVTAESPVQIIKYIDDSNIIEGIWIEHGTMHITTNKTSCVVVAKRTQDLINRIRDRADEIGMVVNEDKTQSLCITGQHHTEVRTKINVGASIESSDRLTMLGFDFGTAPTLTAHFERIRNSYRKRYWTMIHWKRSGFKGEDLYSLYEVFVRPVIEYCNVVYHPILTTEQAEELEGMQRKIFRLAYGNSSYSGAVREKRVQTLEERREAASDKFVSKAIKTKKFDTWFPRRDDIGIDLRNRRRIAEDDYRTKRAFNSPIAAYRRRANKMIANGVLTLE